MRKVSTAVVFLLGCLVSAQAAVTGRVVDAAGSPVGDAMITYTDIANRLVYVYTCVDGMFSIPAPSDWSLDHLPMYNSGCASSVKTPTTSAAAATAFNITVTGRLLGFSVNKSNSSVRADVFDCSGRRVSTLFNHPFAQGRYMFDPFAKNRGLFSRQVYVVRLSSGASIQTVRVANLDEGAVSSRAGLGLASSSQGETRAAVAKAQGINGIRAGKTGYLPGIATVLTYNDNVGDIKITAVNIEARVDSLFVLMTQDEKIGQLMQTSGCDSGIAARYGLGAYQKGEGSPLPMKGALSTRLKIPIIAGNDFVHGGRQIYFPHNIGLGCTRDTLLTELAYRIYAMNCLSLYNNEDFAPCIDLHRNDFSGRVYEGFSETPEVVSMMARAAVRGVQGTDLTSGYTMMATLKHWAYAGGTTNGVTKGNVPGDMGMLSQIHAPPFITSVKAGAAGVMTGYQSVNSVAMAINKTLITDTLKNAYKFDGLVITDWATSTGQVAASINAGHDILMCVDTATFKNVVKAAVTAGTIVQSRIDDAVKRILRVKFRLGLFENPWPNPNLANLAASADHRAVARACVRKSLVLLKNANKALPIAKTANVHVVGAWADNMGYQCGGWSATGSTLVGNTDKLATGDEGWQGTAVAHGIPGATTVLAAIKATCTGTVTYSTTAANIPPTADVIVVVVGETAYAENNGDKTNIALPADQQALVQTLAASNKPVVTILITGRPNVLGTIPTNSSALVAAWLPGTEGGGIADVIFGDNNFTGKLAHTWPANNAQEPINNGAMGDATGTDKTAPLYPFGFGLTY